MYVISGSPWEVVDEFAIKCVQSDPSVFKLGCVYFEIIMMSVIEKLKASTFY